jgi:hypothetical protein
MPEKIQQTNRRAASFTNRLAARRFVKIVVQKSIGKSWKILWSLEIGHWGLNGIWGLGIWSFEPKTPPKLSRARMGG